MLFLLIYGFSFGQDTINYQPKLSVAEVSINFGNRKIYGSIYEIKDSSIVVSNSHRQRDYLRKSFQTKVINCSQIDVISVRHKNLGALYGALGGLLAGAIIGYAQGDDTPGIMSFTATDKAILGGFLGVLPGTLIGGLIGSIKIKIPINGNFENFNKKKELLKKYSYIR